MALIAKNRCKTIKTSAMTSIEYLFNELWETPKDKLTWHSILKKAKEIEFSQETSDNSPKKENKTSFGEISDEEIDSSISYDSIDPYVQGYLDGAKWYREQLKNK
jgi:hypothetical protein